MEKLSLLTLFVASLVACKSAAQPAVPPTRSFTLVYTVNSFGTTEPVGCPHKILHDGGLARRMTCLRQLAAVGQPLLILDGGAALFPDVDKPGDEEREKLFSNAELIMEAMNRMGYQALAVGTTDLLLGLGELTHLAGRAKFPLLCANLTVPAGFPFKAYTVTEVAGVRVGVIGLLVDTIGRVYLSKVAPGGQVLPAIPAARKAVEELRGKVDLVVVLSHVRQDVNRQLAREVEGVDLVIDPSIEYGNHHPRIKDEDWEEPVGPAAILRADGNGSTLGVVEIEFRKRGAGMGSRTRLQALTAREAAGTLEAAEREELTALKGRNLFTLRRLPLSPHYADDLEAASLLDAHKGGADVTKVAARPAPAGRADYLTAAACKQCHEKQHQFWTTTRHFNALDGIRASGDDRKPECISCHTTGYGPAFLAPAEAGKYSGIQCEGCHGTRPEHVKDPAANRFGAVSESVCLPCHNEDILHKDFSYRSALARVQCPSGK
jgi:hypothetical protein